MPNSPTPQPIDPAQLKQAADRLAELLNDLKADGCLLTATESIHHWTVVQAPGDATSARADVMETVHGRWEFAGMRKAHGESSLVDRLRAITAEVEALTASAVTTDETARCNSIYRPADSEMAVQCGLADAEHDPGVGGTRMHVGRSGGMSHWWLTR